MADPELEHELRATLAARKDLPPEYEAALVKSFVEKLDREVEAKVRELVGHERGRKKAKGRRRRGNSCFGLASIALGIPVSAVVASDLHGVDSLIGVIVAWAAIEAVNIARALDR